MNMTVKDLKKFFKEHLVPANVYSFKGGSHKNRICMGRTKKGWEIYFSDKKKKIGLMQFASESEACQRMKEEVLKLMEQVYGLSWRNFA